MIKNKLKEIWKGDKKMLVLCNQIKYVHSRLKYEMEIPNELVKGDKKLDILVMVSNRCGF